MLCDTARNQSSFALHNGDLSAPLPQAKRYALEYCTLLGGPPGVGEGVRTSLFHSLKSFGHLAELCSQILNYERHLRNTLSDGDEESSSGGGDG
jgi:hypothetical protein